MRIVSIPEVEAIAVTCLGFDSESADLSTPEALVSLIRKTASFLCPCSPETLAKDITRLLAPLRPNDSLHDTVRETIDCLTAYGDLIEISDTSGPTSKAVLYLAAPSFLQASEQLFLLFGAIPDGEDATPPHLRQNVEPVICSRRLRAQDPKEALEALLQAGFISLKLEAWLKCPPVQSACDFVARYGEVLATSGPAGNLEDVTLIDPTRPVNYYKGRWTKLKKQTGRFIARRPQSYGADLWCFIEVEDGLVTRLIDFPQYETHWRAFDEAWHLLQALDAFSGHPQIFRVRNGTQKGTAAIDVFSPIPTWAARRWDAVGVRTVPNSALISYAFPESQIDAESHFATERMWLKRL